MAKRPGNKRVLGMDRDLCVASSVLLQARGFSRGWKYITAGLCVFHLSRRLDIVARSAEVHSHFPRTVARWWGGTASLRKSKYFLPPIVSKISSATCGKVCVVQTGAGGGGADALLDRPLFHALCRSFTRSVFLVRTRWFG